MSTALSYIATTDLEGSINSLSLTAVVVGSVLLIILVLLSIWLTERKPKIKKFLFSAMVFTVASVTLVISGGTVFLNVQSFAGGPVHWHADFEIWACGNELELRDPQGLLSNKIGTPTLHEHNDKRIHLEGVPITPKDASLGKFMEVIGGNISKSSLVVPLNNDKLTENGPGEEDGDGPGAQAPEQLQPFMHTQAEGKVATFINGEVCGNQTANVQTFVYAFDQATKTYKQTKISDPAGYTIGHHEQVPPGDCIIVEFAPPKDRTDKLCKQYGIRDTNKCEQFGVPADKRSICEDKEVQ